MKCQPLMVMVEALYLPTVDPLSRTRDRIRNRTILIRYLVALLNREHRNANRVNGVSDVSSFKKWHCVRILFCHRVVANSQKSLIRSGNREWQVRNIDSVRSRFELGMPRSSVTAPTYPALNAVCSWGAVGEMQAGMQATAMQYVRRSK